MVTTYDEKIPPSGTGPPNGEKLTKRVSTFLQNVAKSLVVASIIGMVGGIGGFGISTWRSVNELRLEVMKGLSDCNRREAVFQERLDNIERQQERHNRLDIERDRENRNDIKAINRELSHIKGRLDQ